MELLFDQVLMAFGFGLFGAVLFAAIGLISGTDETTTIAPLTLLIILLGAPPVGIFTFWMVMGCCKAYDPCYSYRIIGYPR